MTSIFPQPPLAATVSSQARAALAPILAAAAQPMPEMAPEQMRTLIVSILKPVIDARAGRYGVTVTPGSLGGVPVQMVSRKGAVLGDKGPLLINFHGGGFEVDSGSLTESIPIAGLTGIPVASVMYRLAPEHPFPAAVDDALAAYRAALKTRAPRDIAIFGTSAGAMLCSQLIMRLRKEGLPLPVAVGFFSGAADAALAGDIEGYLPPLKPGKSVPEAVSAYFGSVDRHDPLASPYYGDLADMPPTLLMSSTRDLLLSQTVRYHLALRHAGNRADLVVYEGMPHAFWAYTECPETDAALTEQARFLAIAVGHPMDAAQAGSSANQAR